MKLVDKLHTWGMFLSLENMLAKYDVTRWDQGDNICYFEIIANAMFLWLFNPYLGTEIKHLIDVDSLSLFSTWYSMNQTFVVWYYQKSWKLARRRVSIGLKFFINDVMYVIRNS